jgi:hypothetical protein
MTRSTSCRSGGESWRNSHSRCSGVSLDCRFAAMGLQAAELAQVLDRLGGGECVMLGHDVLDQPAIGGERAAQQAFAFFRRFGRLWFRGHGFISSRDWLDRDLM